MVSSPVTPRGRTRTEPKPVDHQLEELWREFKDEGDPAVRERLILHYAPLVKYVAGRVGVGLPPNIEQADLVSYGIFGLIDAIEKFDLSRAIKFETYAISRIKGAIIDELRSIDWIPRSIRSKAREVERATRRSNHACTALPPSPRWPKSLALASMIYIPSSVRSHSSTF
jgi:RNA polymerase sigma factor for flagellar operon FliA